MKASESAREAAMRLLDQQAIRFHKDGTFRDWDNTVQAFTQAEARGRIAGIREAAKLYAAGSGPETWDYFGGAYASILSLIPGEPA